MATSSDLTPEEWLAHLGPKLLQRQPAIEYWRRYYEGDHDLPAGPSQHVAAYKRFQALARTNLCKLCAESMVHRMTVTGYRDGKSKSADVSPIWKLWQEAKLDARQYTVWRKAFSLSAGYVVVGVDPKKPKKPLVTIEGPENVIVETDAGDPTLRLAALRLWHDPIAKKWFATVFLPGMRHHFETVKEFSLLDNVRRLGESATIGFGANAWQRRGDPTPSLPDIPVVPFLNGDEGEDPVAEFNVGIDVQNRLNLTLLNRLTAERYGAFRQRFLTNFTPEVDEATGLPIPPLNPGQDHLFVIPPPEPGFPESKLGDLQQTDTSQMLRAVEADMRAFAAVTLTPVYYLPGDLINIGADSIMALDAGHVSKIRQRMAYWGEQLEEVLTLMAAVAELDVKDLDSSEIVWARPENFNPAATADFAAKLSASGFPLPMIAEEIGWTPQRVNQLRAEQAQQQLMAAMQAAAAAQPPGAPGAAPGRPATPGAPSSRPGGPPASAPRPNVNPTGTQRPSASNSRPPARRAG